MERSSKEVMEPGAELAQHTAAAAPSVAAIRMPSACHSAPQITAECNLTNEG